MSFLRILCLMVGFIAFTPEAGETARRSEHAAQIRRAIESSGVRPTAKIDQKLSSMSDRELKQLANEQAKLGTMDKPLMIVAGAIATLLLLVTLLVKKVD